MTSATTLDIDEGPRSKRGAILRAAVEQFGETGYEATKWAEVADRVGIGQTALYHYFESKAHCLFTIMRLQLQQSHQVFLESTAGSTTAADALQAAVRGAYDKSEQEVLQLRILQSNFSLLSGTRATEREEAERVAARELTRLIEKDWTDLLARGIRTGEFPERDPRLLAQAVLGLIVSVWRWYRPGGPVKLADVSEFMVGCCLRMVTA